MKRIRLKNVQVCNDNDYAVMFKVVAGDEVKAEYVHAGGEAGILHLVEKYWNADIKCELRVDKLKEFKAYETGLEMAKTLGRESEL